MTIPRPRGAYLTSLLLLLLMGGCTQYEEPLPRRDRLNYPVGLAIHPSGRYLYVVNTNFDSRFDEELGGTVAVIDTSDNHILAESSPYIPSFGSYIRLNESATRAYLTSRLGNSVIALDVASQGQALSCSEGGEISADSTECTLQRVPDTIEGNSLPSDPFGFDVATVTRNGIAHDILGLAHLNSRSVTALSLEQNSLAGASFRNDALLEGSNTVARKPGTLDFYVAGRASDRVGVFAPYVDANGEVEAILNRGSIVLNRTSSAVDARGIAFHPNGHELYVTTRRPDALHIIDTGPDDLESGLGSADRIKATIVLPSNPADIALHRRPGDDRLLLYVPCYGDRSIQVIDPAAQVVLDEIKLDASPYQMVTEGMTAQRCDSGSDICRGFVTLFSDSAGVDNCSKNGQGCGSVAIIELSPNSPRYHQVISKIQ